MANNIPKSKRSLFAKAVIWIAINDNAGMSDNEDEVSGYISTALVADLFEVDAEYVAGHILSYRKEIAGEPK